MKPTTADSSKETLEGGEEKSRRKHLNSDGRKKTKDELPAMYSTTYIQLKRALEDLGECWMYGPEFKDHYKLKKSAVTEHGKKFPGLSMRYAQGTIWSGSKETIAYLKEQLYGPETEG